MLGIAPGFKVAERGDVVALVSADGRSRWDGKRWVLASTPPAVGVPLVGPNGQGSDPKGSLTRRLFLALIPLSYVVLNTTSAAASSSSGPTLNVVAHEDDDLLFLSPDLLHVIQAGGSVRTIFVTAGDDGQ